MRYKIVISGLAEDQHAIVRAIVRGQLALHPSLRASRAGMMWTLTHVPTGAAVMHLYTCQIARRALRELQALNWRFTRTDGPAYMAFVDASRLLRSELRYMDEVARGLS